MGIPLQRNPRRLKFDKQLSTAEIINPSSVKYEKNPKRVCFSYRPASKKDRKSYEIDDCFIAYGLFAGIGRWFFAGNNHTADE